MEDKLYVSAQSLLEDSFLLAKNVVDSGFKPNFIVGLWRGGTPVGIAVQELLDYFGIKTDHIAIRSSAYEGINKIGKTIRIHGLSYIVKNCNSDDRLLIVDDVFDSGLTINALIQKLKKMSRKNTPEIKVATVYFKPKKNQTNRTPDFYVHETDKWIVFPHELSGLTQEEILNHKSLKMAKQFFR
ncbi:hypoxanthine phosphoribosyltransferase [Candidatus Woesearchaeota archaeon]|nr:hypoxanthine phosphoribosyltransferase [Candidatus Woesearchaeota archaeon]